MSLLTQEQSFMSWHKKHLCYSWVFGAIAWARVPHDENVQILNWIWWCVVCYFYCPLWVPILFLKQTEMHVRNCTIAFCELQTDKAIDYMNTKMKLAVTSWTLYCSLHCLYAASHQLNDTGQAPVPLSIFGSNSKFDENLERSSFKYIRPITPIFCTRHDSDTVVTCAKYRCDRQRIFYTRVFWIFIEFRIRSKYA